MLRPASSSLGPQRCSTPKSQKLPLHTRPASAAEHHTGTGAASSSQAGHTLAFLWQANHPSGRTTPTFQETYGRQPEPGNGGQNTQIQHRNSQDRPTWLSNSASSQHDKTTNVQTHVSDQQSEQNNGLKLPVHLSGFPPKLDLSGAQELSSAALADGQKPSMAELLLLLRQVGSNMVARATSNHGQHVLLWRF